MALATSVDVFSMAYLNNRHDETLIFEFINHSADPLTNSVTRLAREFFTVIRARII